MTNRTRVAILGGGVGALSAAYALSEIDPTGQKYEITIYQLGWRLGGKTANGRNADLGERIEEHGLHIWAGFYENSFTVMRSALKTLNRPAGAAQRTIGEAFVRQNHVFLTEKFEEEWLPWPVWFEPAADPTLFPGRDNLLEDPGPVVPPLPELMARAFAMIAYDFIYYRNDWTEDSLATGAEILAGLPPKAKAQVVAGVPFLFPHDPFELARILINLVANNPFSDLLRDSAIFALDLLLRDVRSELARNGLRTQYRRYLLMADLNLRIMIGCLRNDVLRDGLQAIDRFEFREFLAQAAPMPDPRANPLVNGLYDYAFAFREGRFPEMSACGAVQGLVRLFLTYKGAFFYKATAGMGDTICTAIYEVLKSRGVRFRFFHRVMRLTPDASGQAIETIDINRQAELARGRTDYEPLRVVKGLGCWPAEPLWDQLQDGDDLDAKGVDFEDLFSEQPQGTDVQLKRGADFDHVILGISLGALESICAPLVTARSEWRDMVEHLKTARTQAFQLWLNVPVHELGGPFTQPVRSPTQPGPESIGPISTAFEKPFDTYADMSHLLPSEDWGHGADPKSVAYFCSTMGDDEAGNDQQEADAKVKLNSIEWMQEHLPVLWPNIVKDGAFRWDLLHADGNLKGEARFDQQFWQANVNLSERYVLALPGTLEYRLEPAASGFDNLYLAGDWTKVPEINAGCVEVAVMSGLLAASGLSGVDIPIVSGKTLYPTPQSLSFLPGRSAPPYVEYGGWITLPPPPSAAFNADFYSWALPADPARMQDLVDRSLNEVAGWPQFQAIGNWAFLSMIRTDELICKVPPYSEHGMMSETDIGFWLLVARYDPGSILPKLGWFPTTLLVDNPHASTSGREIWGYPKYSAHIVTPGTGGPAGPIRVDALVIERHGPGERAGFQRILSVSPGNSLTGKASITAAEAMLDLYQGDRSKQGGNDGLPAMVKTLLARGGLPTRVFYLKQFRTAADPPDACYQRIISGALILDKTHDGGVLNGDWTIDLKDTDSLPFVRDLGLGAAYDTVSVGAKMAFWSKVDFTVGLAS